MNGFHVRSAHLEASGIHIFSQVLICTSILYVDFRERSHVRASGSEHTSGSKIVFFSSSVVTCFSRFVRQCSFWRKCPARWSWVGRVNSTTPYSDNLCLISKLQSGDARCGNLAYLIRLPPGTSVQSFRREQNGMRDERPCEGTESHMRSYQALARACLIWFEAVLVADTLDYDEGKSGFCLQVSETAFCLQQSERYGNASNAHAGRINSECHRKVRRGGRISNEFRFVSLIFKTKNSQFLSLNFSGI